MPLLASLLPPAPLFVAKIVPADLSPLTTIADARRDLSAVGTSGMRMTSDFTRESLIVDRGRALLRPGLGDGSHPTVEPVALRSPRGVILAVANLAQAWTYCEADVAPNGFRLGRRVSKPTLAHPALPASGHDRLPFVFRLRSNRYARWTAPAQIGVAWWHLPHGPQVGTAEVHYEAEDAPTGLDVGISLIKTSSGVMPLASAVRLPSGIPLDEILWVSHEGWMIVRAGDHALAWLYPIKR